MHVRWMLMSGVIAAATGSMFVVNGSREPEYPADFVYNSHDDSSLAWTLVVAPNTWRAIRDSARATRNERRYIDGEVLRLIGAGFVKRQMSAQRCALTDIYLNDDGSVVEWRVNMRVNFLLD